jgi:hypothetical protein
MAHLRCLVAVCVLASSTIAAAADAMVTYKSSATTFTWSEAREHGAGTLTATFQSHAHGKVAEYLITDSAGDIGNHGGITSLLPPNGYQGNDNILYYPTTPNLDGSGQSFMDGGFDWNFKCVAAGCELMTSDTPTATYSDTFTFTAVKDAAGRVSPSAVPGPTIGAGLPGLIFAGFAGGGLLVWWHRKRRAQAVA